MLCASKILILVLEEQILGVFGYPKGLEYAAAK
jgi:hypothetical protein